MKMIKSGIFAKLVELKRRFLDSMEPSGMKGYDGKSFTRKRRLTMGHILTMILRCNPYSLQIRIDDYFKEIGRKGDVVTKQAFSKARTNLDPDVVKSSFRLTAETMSGAEDLTLYRNRYRLCAIDGSDVVLDNAKELLDHFGGSGPNKDCATALASVCFDPLNDIILDGGLYRYGTGERDAAREHFKAVSTLPLPKGAENLYIFDRGYPSKELFAEMIDEDLRFLMRVRKKFNADFEMSGKNKKVGFVHNGKQYFVRVFKVTLNTGEQELIVTNMRAKHLSSREIGDLYFKRWRIEVKFDSLKNKLELENMSGRRVVTTYQDFWAKLDLANMIAALEYETNAVIKENTADSPRKYRQITNENRLISKFSERYIELLTNDDSAERIALFDDLINDIARFPSEVKPGRQCERKLPRKKKFCDRRKRTFR
jgi:hypothetical protein